MLSSLLLCCEPMLKDMDLGPFWNEDLHFFFYSIHSNAEQGRDLFMAVIYAVIRVSGNIYSLVATPAAFFLLCKVRTVATKRPEDLEEVLKQLVGRSY